MFGDNLSFLDEVLSFGGLFLRVAFMVPDPRSIVSSSARKFVRSTHAVQTISHGNHAPYETMEGRKGIN